MPCPVPSAVALKQLWDDSLLAAFFWGRFGLFLMQSHDLQHSVTHGRLEGWSDEQSKKVQCRCRQAGWSLRLRATSASADLVPSAAGTDPDVGQVPDCRLLAGVVVVAARSPHAAHTAAPGVSLSIHGQGSDEYYRMTAVGRKEARWAYCVGASDIY